MVVIEGCDRTYGQDEEQTWRDERREMGVEQERKEEKEVEEREWRRM